MPERKRIFISYKRNVEPDERVALDLHQALRAEHDVFIDKEMTTGTRWAERIEAELRRSDFLITLLSAESVNSEMVRGEIETAHHLGQGQAGRPAILPVRLAYREPFCYPLSAWLNPINWALWRGAGDTPRVLEELRRAITGGRLEIGVDEQGELFEDREAQATSAPLPHAQPRALERPGGAMAAQSAFYVERPSDAVAMEAIEDEGVTLVIKAPRQMGKSSLLIRTMGAGAAAGKKIAFVDFQLFGKDALGDADLFFRQLCSLISDELELEDCTEEYWRAPLGNSQRASRYLGRHLLKALDEPLYLAMDEVDAVFDSPFRSDFFGMLRSWHNRRGRPDSIWRRLDLALVTSTEPYQLIEDLNQSPFNVGEVLELRDFTPEEAGELNRRHGEPLSPDELEQVTALVGGQPFLLRRALYLVAAGRTTLAELLATATADRGPFGDHLRYHLFRIYDKPDLVNALTQVLKHQRCRNEEIFWRLRGAGLVRREEGRALPRNQLYATYFGERLDV